MASSDQSAHRFDDALFANRFQMACDLRDKSRMCTQIASENRLDFEQCSYRINGIRVQGRADRFRQCVGEGIRDRVIAPCLVLTAEVRDPPGQRKGKTFGRRAPFQVGAHAFQPALRQLLRAVGRDLLQAVIERVLRKRANSSAR